jgi:hypothetical protein
MRCTICDDTGWVCEFHQDRPSGEYSTHESACDCGGAASCICNDDPVRDMRNAARIICGIGGALE